jgi:hypothetical protein
VVPKTAAIAAIPEANEIAMPFSNSPSARRDGERRKMAEDQQKD